MPPEQTPSDLVAWLDETLQQDWQSLSVDASLQSPSPLAVAFEQRVEELLGTPERYLDLDELGKGGMGVVLRSLQVGLRRPVAVKRLRQADSPTISRHHFLDEALISARLEHPTIVPIYDLGRASDGALFLAMKLVGGQSWFRLLWDEPEPLERHLEILIQVCNGVAFAHRQGIVHNDLKPSNVMVGELGEVLLMDWGLARKLDAEGGYDVDMPLGTPVYMSPEACGNGCQLTVRSDVYQLGGILCRILTGAAPHQVSKSMLEVLQHAQLGILPTIPKKIPHDLAHICLTALAPDPAQRFADVQAFQAALRAHLAHRESLRISAAAAATLHAAWKQRTNPSDERESSRNALYENFAEAVAGFRQARQLWAENPEAREGEQRARLTYASAALSKGDLGLAENQAKQLAAQGAETAELDQAIADGRARQRQEARSRRRLQWTVFACAVALFAGLAGWLMQSEVQRREIAAQKEEIARQFQFQQLHGEIAVDALRALTNEVSNNLLDRLGDAHSQEVAEELLEVALEGWEDLREASLEQRTVSRHLLMAQIKSGELRVRIAGNQAALEDSEQLIDKYRAALARYPADTAFVVDFVRALAQHADNLGRTGAPARSAAILDSALVLLDTVSAREVVGSEVDHLQLSLLGMRAQVLLEAGETEASIEHLQRALALDLPANLRARGQLLADLASAEASRGRFEVADACFRRAVALFEQRLLDHPDEARTRQDAIFVWSVYAAFLNTRDGARANAFNAQALALQRELTHDNPNVQNRSLLAATLTNAAPAESDPTRQRAMYAEAIALFEELLQAIPEDNDLRVNLCRTLGSLANKLGPGPDAEALLDRAIELGEEADGLHWLAVTELTTHLVRRALLYAEAGIFEAAQASLERAATLLLQLHEREPQLREVAVQLAELRSHQASVAAERGELSRAQELLTEARNRAAAFPPDDPELPRLRNGLIDAELWLRRVQGEPPAELHRWWREALLAELERWPEYLRSYRAMVRCCQQEANFLLMQGDLEAGTEASFRHVEAARALLPRVPEREGLEELVGALYTSARALAALDRIAAAITASQEGCQLVVQLREMDPEEPQWLVLQAYSNLQLAILLVEADELAAAGAALRLVPEAVGPAAAQLAPGEAVAIWLDVCQLAQHLGDPELAHAAASQGWRLLIERGGPPNLGIAMALEHEALLEGEQPDEALAVLMQCLDWLQGTPLDPQAQNAEIELLLRLGRLACQAGELETGAAALEAAVQNAARMAAGQADPQLQRHALQVKVKAARLLLLAGLPAAAEVHLRQAQQAWQELQPWNASDRTWLKRIEDALHNLAQ